MNCEAELLDELSKCFRCLSKRTLKAIKTYLLCRIANTPSSPLLNGLIGYYEFEEAADSPKVNQVANYLVSGGNPLNLTGSFFDSGDGKIGLGLTSPGEVGKLTVANQASPGTAYRFPGSFSFSFWFKAASVTDLTNDFLFGIHAGSGDLSGDQYLGFLSAVSDTEKVFSFLLILDNGSTFEIGNSSTLSDLNFHHFVVVWDNDQQRGQTYFDGVSIGSSPAFTGLNQNNTGVDFTLGGAGIPADPFAGTFDEFGIWNRVLTAEEVTTLYNAGAGLQYPFS